MSKHEYNDNVMLARQLPQPGQNRRYILVASSGLLILLYQTVLIPG